MSIRNKNVLVLNLNETTRDPRVRRISQTLAELGANVHVLSPRQPGQPESESLGPLSIIRFALPERFQDSDMMELAQVDPEAAELVSQCEPQVLQGFATSGAGYFGKRMVRFGRRNLARLAPLRGLRPPQQDILNARYIVRCNVALFKRITELKPDIVWANDLDTLLAGWMGKRALQVPLVYDAHEIYPEQLPDAQRSSAWHRFFTELEQRLINQTELRLTVAQSLARYFETRYQCDPVITVRNCPRRALLAPEPKAREQGERLKVLYHGAYFEHRGIEQVIEAVAKHPQIDLTLRGFGPIEEKLRALSTKLSASNVQFADPVAVDELIHAAASEHVGLCPFLPKSLNTQLCLPNKYFEYLAAGLATASANLPELAEATNNWNTGMLFEPLQTAQLAEQLYIMDQDIQTLNEFRKNSHRAAREDLHWENEELTLKRSAANLL